MKEKIIGKFVQIINDFIDSFKTNNKGFSSKKWSAFVILLLDVLAHIIWLKYAYVHEKFEYLGEVLIIDYSFIAALLGLTTWQMTKGNLSSGQNKPTE